jgi:hypothetical protein
VERLVAVRCPSLLVAGERGEEVRTFLAVLDTVGELCPWVEAVRLGVCVLPAKGPSRLFGGERAVTGELGSSLERVLGPGGAGVGVADGLFAAQLAAQSELVVPRGGTAGFLEPWSVTVLGRPELAVTLQRLGVHTLGRFATLSHRHVLARFGADAVSCHRVARAEEGELPGARDPRIGRLLREVGGPVVTGPRQDGFFGGASAADRRAAASVARVQRRLGTEGVVRAQLRGGHDPADRVQFIPWGAGSERAVVPASSASGEAPWPGRLPPPSPVIVPASPWPVELVGADRGAVGVTGRGLLTAEPGFCSLGGGPWRRVTGWAGPWPAHESWWSVRRRRAHLQVMTEPDTALLLRAEQGRWWMTGLYD